MNLFIDAWHYATTSSHWSGQTGIGWRIAQHIGYSALVVALSSLVAVPIGMMIGHHRGEPRNSHRRGEVVIVGFANAMRALPTLGVLTFLVLLLGIGTIGPIVALLTVGIPPLLAGVYSGIANVDATVVDAARAMGMTERQILFRVELPNAAPLMLAGLRSATLNVIATATIAAYVNLGGLGRYIFDGIALYKYDRVLVGAVLVAALALAADGSLAALGRVGGTRHLRGGLGT